MLLLRIIAIFTFFVSDIRVLSCSSFSYVYFLRSLLIGKSNSSKSHAQRVPATACSSGFICHFQWHFMKFNCMCVNRPQKIQNKITPSKSNYEYQWFCLEWFYSFKMFLITFLPIYIYIYIYIYIHCLAYNLTRFTQRIIYENNVLECSSFTGKNAN